jgi:simple sugar transport system ATP-binding protein
MQMTANNMCVQLRGIVKQYPGSLKKANNGISLSIKKGEILCVAGENGAGKTTLMKILCGLETPDAGEIFLNGKKEEIKSALAANRLGIGMVHQHFMLFPEYTVAENIVMGIEPRKWGIFYDAKKADEQAGNIIDEHNFPINSGDKVKDLTLGQMQQVEICRVLHRNAQIIILDEPTSILTEQETDSLFKTLKALASGGRSVVLITHKLQEIKKICDRVAVLRRGELVAIRDNNDIDEYEIARIIVGEDANLGNADLGDADLGENAAPERPPAQEEKKAHNDEPVFAFENVTVYRRRQKRPLLDNVSFGVRKAEILGIAGAGGNGLGVIEAVLGGFLHPARGKVLHRGKDISALNIRALRNQGLSYVPADRLRVGSAPDAAIEENMIINRRHEFMRGLFVDKKGINEFTGKLAENYSIEGARAGEKCSTLSGGNMQKMILAREINWYRDYIVFSEPTWGLDAASAGFIMGEIAALCKKGAAVILISTNIDEIIALSDRIIVMYHGAIIGEFENKRDALTKEAVGNCMQGLAGAGK